MMNENSKIHTIKLHFKIIRYIIAKIMVEI